MNQLLDVDIFRTCTNFTTRLCDSFRSHQSICRRICDDLETIFATNSLRANLALSLQISAACFWVRRSMSLRQSCVLWVKESWWIESTLLRLLRKNGWILFRRSRKMGLSYSYDLVFPREQVWNVMDSVLKLCEEINSEPNTRILLPDRVVELPFIAGNWAPGRPTFVTRPLS